MAGREFAIPVASPLSFVRYLDLLDFSLLATNRSEEDMKRLFWLAFAPALASILVSAPNAHAIHGGKFAMNKGSRAVIGVRGDDFRHGCTGVVVHPRVFVIAAHCTKLLFKGEFNEVFFTARNASSSSLAILNIYNHPEFIEDFKTKDDSSGLERATIDYDIAVVTLKEPIQDKYVLSDIPRLATMNDLVAGIDAPPYIATAMGMYNERGKAYLGDEDNSAKRSLPHYIDHVNQTVLFLKSRVLGQGVCHGDSGGAIFKDPTTPNEPAVLVGLITVIAEYCGKRDEYSYAESIAPHVPFIRQSAAKDGIEL